SSEYTENSLADAAAHAAQCDYCGSLLARYASVTSDLASAKAEGSAQATTQCPPEEVLLQLAAGAMPSGEAERFMNHAANCDHCGPVLRQATEDFSDDANPEEPAQIAAVSSSEWQRKLAARLSGTDRIKTLVGAPEMPSRWAILFPRFAFAAAFAVVLTIVAWYGFVRLSSSSPDQLIARAYSENRTLEVRIAGASHAELR